MRTISWYVISMPIKHETIKWLEKGTHTHILFIDSASSYSPEPLEQLKSNLAQSVLRGRAFEFIQIKNHAGPHLKGRLFRVIENLLVFLKKIFYSKTFWPEELKLSWKHSGTVDSNHNHRDINLDHNGWGGGRVSTFSTCREKLLKIVSLRKNI